MPTMLINWLSVAECEMNNVDSSNAAQAVASHLCMTQLLVRLGPANYLLFQSLALQAFKPEAAEAKPNSLSTNKYQVQLYKGIALAVLALPDW